MFFTLDYLEIERKFNLPTDIPHKLSNTLNSPFGLYLPIRDLENADFLELKIEQTTSFYLMMEEKQGYWGFCNSCRSRVEINNRRKPALHTRISKNSCVSPKTINFFQGKEVMSIMIVWIDGSPYDVWISRGDKTANHPTGIGGLVAEHLKPL